MNKSNLRVWAAWAGLLAPLLFVGVFTVEGSLRPGYDPLSMYISALSLGPRGPIQMTNFIVLGLLLLVFTLGLALEFPTGRGPRAGRILLTVVGGLFLISGPFVMDPTGTPVSQMTVHGTIHGLAGGFVFLLMPVIIFVYLGRFRRDPNWRGFYVWTLVLGIVEAGGVLFFTAVSKAPAAAAAFAPWMGLIQRCALIPFMFWQFLFAWRLLGRSRQAVQ